MPSPRTARAYLGIATDPGVTQEARRLDDAYNQARELERERLAEHGRYLDPNVIYLRPSSNDEPLAHLLKQALRESKAGYPQVADDIMERARRMQVDHFEVDRVDAMLASFRKETEKAKSLYNSALQHCANDEKRAWVGFFFAGLLGGQGRDLPAGIKWAEEAHRFFDSYDTALQLGNLYVWSNRFAEGAQMIESAMERAPSKPRFARIATTSLVECFRRWSNADLGAGRSGDGLWSFVRSMSADAARTSPSLGGQPHRPPRGGWVALLAGDPEVGRPILK